MLTLRVRERVGEIQNINLPILAELELLGDERETASRQHGTFYRETITVVAHDPGRCGNSAGNAAGDRCARRQGEGVV